MDPWSKSWGKQLLVTPPNSQKLAPSHCHQTCPQRKLWQVVNLPPPNIPTYPPKKTKGLIRGVGWLTCHDQTYPTFFRGPLRSQEFPPFSGLWEVHFGRLRGLWCLVIDVCHFRWTKSWGEGCWFNVDIVHLKYTKSSSTVGWKFQCGFCMHSLHPTPLYRALHLCEVWLVSAAPTRNHHSRAQCLGHQVTLTFVSGCNSQSLTTGLLGWIYFLQLGPSLRVVHFWITRHFLDW